MLEDPTCSVACAELWLPAAERCAEPDQAQAFERVAPEETTLVVLNYGKVRGSSTLIGGDSMVVSFPAGTTLVDALEPGRTFQTTHTGCVAGSGESCVVVSVPARKFRVLLPQ